MEKTPRTYLKKLIFIIILMGVSTLSAQEFDPELFAEIQPLPPLESLSTMVVQDGYKMELAAHEPMIQEPVLFTFDGDGRLYVAEMLTYMQDAEGTGKFEKTSRIKRLEDQDDDGVFDSYTIFADELLLPRMIQTLDEGRILVRETNTLDLLLISDTDGDGVSDTKERVYEGGVRGGNLEHQPNGLIYGIDNWLYVTYTNKRYKFIGNKIVAETIAYGGGQWGLGQDHLGRLYYSAAGGQNPAFAFQFPSVYSRITVEDEQAPGFREVFPLDKTPDVQGGLPLLRDDNTLNHFTGGGGQSIYQGALFDDMQGDFIITEPVGNLIRRAKVVRENGYTTLVHPYQEQRTEFIASTDANFRPVWTGTAPDGSLLILDMYRGIIQEGNWTQKGSYLRGVIDEYGFDKIIGRGRLFRVTKDNVALGPRPQLLSKSPSQLVEYLSHENQWWRLEAQKLIVISQDKTVIPQLKILVRNHLDPLAKIHGLWTLEGLAEIDAELLVEMINSPHSDVRTTAIRISEQLVSAGNSEIEALWRALASDNDIEVAQQSVLSAYYTMSDYRHDILASAKAAHGSTKGLVAIEDAMINLALITQRRIDMEQNDAALAAALTEGQRIYQSMCSTCHGDDGRGTPSGANLIAPSLHDNARVTGNVAALTNILLQGMSGPIDGTSYAGGMMPSVASNGDEWIANVLTYVRNDFDNQASLISAQQVAQVKALNALRESMWTQAELDAMFATEISDKSDWRLSTNLGVSAEQPVENLIDGDQDSYWEAGAPREAGQSLTIELPSPARITEVIVDSSRLSNYYSRSYRIEFSNDAITWSEVLNNPVGSMEDKNQTLGNSARFVRIINQVGGTRSPWRIREISLVGSYLN